MNCAPRTYLILLLSAVSLFGFFLGSYTAAMDEGRTSPEQTATGDHSSSLREPTQRTHWAYGPLSKSLPPQLPQDGKATDFVRNHIDRFVLGRLEASKLVPAPEADPRTLVRRLYFDLLGLPPTPADVDEYLNDPSPNAYERLVDRILASPHFGERLAMYWLDLVRYGDTNGYHADVHRNVFPYRDYVINAFNSNKRFDQFTIEQLAGDLLPDATLEQKIASGYNRMNMITTEGGAQAKEYLAKYAADRVRNVSTVWLASTLGCAECHNHKYDPFTARDFYSFAAFFADVKQVGVYPNKVDLDPQMRVPTPAQATELSRLDEQIAALQKALDTPTPELVAAQAYWERSIQSDRIDWLVLRPVNMASQHGTILMQLDDGSILATHARPDTDTYTIVAQSDLPNISAVRLEVLPDESLPNKGPGRAENGNFVLSHLELTATTSGSDNPTPVVLQNASATYEQKGGGLSLGGTIDPAKKNAKSGWGVAEQVGRPNQAIFETKSDVGIDGTTTLTFIIHQTHGGKHTLGRFRLELTRAARTIKAGQSKVRGVPDGIADIVAIAPDKRSAEQVKSLAAHFRSISPLLAPVRSELAATKKQHEDLDKNIPRTLVTVAVEPVEIRVLARGNWMDESGEIVFPAPPHFLANDLSTEATAPSPLEREGAGAANQPDQARPNSARATQLLTRLDLARWLVSRENPLTARVFVNRLWKQLLGQGLVRTTDDFGLQGAPPTHPELLDWLALQFIDSGWDVKHTIKLIAMSGTYRQTSQAGPELRRIDPYNQWLARQGRFRLDAEMVRDNALAISGLLTRKVGGRSVKPYQPDGYWDHCNTFQGKLVYDQDHGEDLYRRGLYSYWKRTFLHPAMLALDAPSREECTADRPRSNTPLQALVLLNDPTYVEAARVFAERIIRDGGPNTEDRIQLAYSRSLSRAARPDELKLLAATHRQHLDQYKSDATAANELIKVGEWPVPPDIDAADLAAWTSVARVILNLHETITRY